MKYPDNLPPLVQLLATEDLPLDDRDAFKKRFLDMLPELRAQAEWTVSHYDYPGEGINSPRRLHASPIGRMDPFSKVGHCSAPACRSQLAKRFGQSVGLYADTAFVSDPFTPDLYYTRRWTNSALDHFIADLTVLRELLPLIQAGIVQFRCTSMVGLCRGCYENFERQMHELTDALFDEVYACIEFEEHRGVLQLISKEIHAPPLHSYLPRRVIKKNLDNGLTIDQICRNAVRGMLYQEIRETFFGFVDATTTSSVVLADSRIGYSAVMELENQLRSVERLNALELERSVTLPWVSNLSLSQVVQLREEASNALPRLREQMASALCRDSANFGQRGPMSNYSNWILQLREESAEVEAELKAIGTKKERLFHNALGLLGLGISVCYFAESQPMVAGLASLVSTLSLIHPYLKDDEKEERQQKGRPGYVLVKAKEILEHAHT